MTRSKKFKNFMKKILKIQDLYFQNSYFLAGTTNYLHWQDFAHLLPCVEILLFLWYSKRWQKWIFLDYLLTSSCKQGLWTTPNVSLFTGSVEVRQKLSFSIFGFSISVLNPNLETQVLKPPKKQNVFNFQFKCWLYSLVLYKAEQWN